MFCLILQLERIALALAERRGEIVFMRTTADLASLITAQIQAPGMISTALPRLSLFRADEPTAPLPAVYDASVCLIAQGAKRVTLGADVAMFDTAHHLVVSIDMPLTGHVTRASAAEPYLCCKIDFDLAALADLAVAGQVEGKSAEMPIIAAYPSDPELIDATCRLVALLDRLGEAAVMSPLIEREIMFRLLLGPHGPVMRRLAVADSHFARIARAAAQIRANVALPVRISELADAAGMSPSSFHQHFKAVTRLTPIEYQKQPRLQEARRLMLANGYGVADAAFGVGYESPSQFSREYARLFGTAPSRDARRGRGFEIGVVAA